jgi:hypothetical protein
VTLRACYIHVPVVSPKVPPSQSLDVHLHLLQKPRPPRPPEQDGKWTKPPSIGEFLPTDWVKGEDHNMIATCKVFLTRHGIGTMDKIALLWEWHGSQLINPLVHSGTGSKTFIPYVHWYI